jgi:hypothetical protein
MVDALLVQAILDERFPFLPLEDQDKQNASQVFYGTGVAN